MGGEQQQPRVLTSEESQKIINGMAGVNSNITCVICGKKYRSKPCPECGGT